MSRAAVAAMTAYTLELRNARTKLNQNERAFDIPAEIKRAVVDRVIALEWNRYPDFESAALRQALGRAYALRVEEILVGNGSNELLGAAIGTFVGPGTPVVIPRPSFALYEKLVAIAGGAVVPIDVDARSGVLPVDEMASAADPQSVVIVCSPNNPTGGVLPPRGLERLLATGAVVLFDRAYGEFAGDALPPIDDRLVTFSTFSKAWGLAALRVGWLASTASTCAEIRKVKLPYSLNIISEAAAIVALEQRSVRDAYVALVVAERERLARELQKWRAVEVFPSAANFISFRTAGARELFEQLCARGILIRNVSRSGFEDALRVTIGSPEDNDAFLEAMGELV